MNNPLNKPKSYIGELERQLKRYKFFSTLHLVAAFVFMCLWLLTIWIK
jgi:hypothetical protein